MALIYQRIPWQELVLSFGLKDKGHEPDSLFSPPCKLALMFLKSYTNFSDRKLIESVNGNLHCQMFCGIILLAWGSLKDYKIVRESIDWIYHQIALMCRHCKIRMPQSKYLDQKQKYFTYQRKRKKLRKETTKCTRSLLLLVIKHNGLLDELEQQLSGQIEMPAKYYGRRKVIRKVYRQQLQMFYSGESTPDRIVSLSKSYIRPIVRGKEVKKLILPDWLNESKPNSLKRHPD